ncbi:MAG: ABC transporter permease [Hespellia sp.]|nr:ABC transporter permease [Hespellia sp.]
MRTVTKTALANVRQNKSRNILCGIAIGLTTLLVFVILTLGNGLLQLQEAAVNVYYPTYHVMYRGVNEEGISQLKAYDDIEKIGLREDFGQIPDDDATILMIAMDDKALALSKMELKEGNFPKEEKDIVVSQNILDELGLQAGIGDEITIPYQIYEGNELGYQQEEHFRICGLTQSTESTNKNTVYAVLFSSEYMKQMIPEKEREYRVMMRLKTAEQITTETIEKRCEEIGVAIGCATPDIVSNTQYLAANYKDPSTYPIIAGIIAIVVIAGILTIYSIYYVSMIPKVQEYGKLKAMGATKRQIRQIVFQEGMLVAFLAIPIGLIVSSMLSKVLMVGVFHYMNDGDAFTKVALTLLKEGKVQILFPWVYLLTIVVTLVMVIFSIFRPMQKAAGISPVEAMRYQADSTQNKKKKRKGYQELNLFRMTKANLQRNRKRTMITILTLSATGILFITMSHILSCSNPVTSAKRAIEEDYKISIDYKESDKMKPELEWTNIQKNNPMNETFLEQLRAVEGVESVKTKSFLMGAIEGITTEDGDSGAYIIGLDQSYEKALQDGVIDGKIDWSEMEKGNQIILADGYMTYYFPELKAGDVLHMSLETGDTIVEKDFEIAAIGEYGEGIASAEFILPKDVMDSLSSDNLTYSCEIEVAENQKEKAYAELKSLADNTGYMETDTYEEELETYEKTSKLLSVMAYAFLIVLGGIGVMNLLNTMVNSIYTRKRELGVMQAIGLSRRQLTHMLQLEGLFYTAGVLVLSLGIGSVAGYGLFLYAKQRHMFDVHYYQYPLVQAVLLVVVVTVIQLALSYGITRSLRRQSLIEQVRYSE